MRDNLTFILDVDGVLTSGQFLYSIKGKIYKIFGPHDNDGLKMLSDKIDIKFVSADKRGFKISQKRVEDMGFELTHVTEQERYDFITSNYEMDKLIFMGDGDADAKILKEAFIGIAPNNARPSAKSAANYITSCNGGEGAVAEACDWIHQKLFK